MRLREQSVEPVHVVGIETGKGSVPASLDHLLREADLIAGGERYLGILMDVRAQRVPLKGDLRRVLEKIAAEQIKGRKVVVLADGDPLFFGIGKLLIEFLGKERVKIYPQVTTLQIAASRIKIPWEGVKTVSLHGRKDLWPLWRALSFHDLVAVYTDRNLNPPRLIEELKRRQVDAFRVIVFEDLGLETEKVTSFEIEDFPEKLHFSSLNFLILQRKTQPLVPLRMGLDDELYIHESGMITKKEVRLISLGYLQIMPENTVWDLGAGCGSVAIEASFLTRNGKVYAVEKERRRIEALRENVRRTGAYIVEPVLAKLPECLDDLPDPDRIFIGGGISRDTEILERAAERLKRGGRLVINAVLLGTLERVRAHLVSLNWPFSIAELHIARSRNLAGDQRFEPLNPVFIVSAQKP